MFRKSLRARFEAFIAAVIMLCTASAANAVPVLFDDHYYEFIAGNKSWTSAQAEALTLTNLGQPGYLVNITSSAENAFIQGLSTSGWIGGTDVGSEGEWYWSDGPESGDFFWTGGSGGTAIGFAAFFGSEPNNLIKRCTQ